LPSIGVATLALANMIAKTRIKAIDKVIGSAEARVKLFSFVFMFIGVECSVLKTSKQMPLLPAPHVLRKTLHFLLRRLFVSAEI
jgi:hypothetical protein